MRKSMKCECGSKMSLTKIQIKPKIFVQGYKCKKCGEIEFTEEHARRMLRRIDPFWLDVLNNSARVSRKKLKKINLKKIEKEMWLP